MNTEDNYLIGIVSDTHGSKQAMLDVMNIFQAQGEPDLIIHLGDVCYHGPRNPLPKGYGPAELATMLKEIPDEKIRFVRGNCDNAADEKACGHSLNMVSRIIDTPLGKIYCEHGDLRDEDQRVYAALEAGARFTLSGHTHIKRLTDIQGVVVLNPGSPTLPKDGSASCALINSSSVRLFNSESGELLREMSLTSE